MIHTIWKNYGETMTEVLDRCKAQDAIVGPATYAGRLDPAAQGVVIILSGDDRYHKDQHLRHDKEYTFDIIVGIGSDTDDIFGIVSNHLTAAQLPEDYVDLLTSLLGTTTQPMPQFSGYRYKGEPLWAHTRSGTPQEILTTSTVYSIELVGRRKEETTAIYDEVRDLCSKQSLSGFRTPEIQHSWSLIPATSVDILTVRARVSSGTYIRTLVHHYGDLLSIPCCACHITRTNILEPLK